MAKSLIILGLLSLTTNAVQFKYTEISQQLEGELGEAKYVTTLHECATYAFRKNAVAILLQHEASSFKCTPFIEVDNIVKTRNETKLYFIADLRNLDTCMFQSETVESITSSMDKCSINRKICDKLKLLKDAPQCKQTFDENRFDHCCSKEHTENCFTLITVQISECKYAYTENAYKVAVARLEGTRLYWITKFGRHPGANVGTHYVRLVMSEKQVSEATHALIDFAGGDDAFFESIHIKSPTSTEKYFNQPIPTQCAGEVNEWQWISSKYKKDNQCVAYMKDSKRSFTLFGKDGVENIFNEEDFALLQENKLAPSERRWCTSW